LLRLWLADVITAFFDISRRVHVLLHVAQLLFPRFLALLQKLFGDDMEENGEAGVALRVQSLRRALPAFQPLYRKMRPHMFSSQLSTIVSRFGSKAAGTAVKSSSEVALMLSLSSSARYLLVAAFLASFNPPQHDKQMFGSGSRALKRRRVTKRSKAIISPMLLGPHPFPLQRLFAITSVLCNDTGIVVAAGDDGDDGDASLASQFTLSGLYAQVASLISMNLLMDATSTKAFSRVGGGGGGGGASSRNALDCLDSVKLEVGIAYSDALRVAQSINIALTSYLHDKS
jgi:hypothetical protein